MKKLVYIAIALVVMFAANSCKEKKETSVISTNDSVVVEEMNDSRYMVCAEKVHPCTVWNCVLMRVIRFLSLLMTLTLLLFRED